MPSDQQASARLPGSDQRLLIESAAALRAQARNAISAETRAHFERLALQYQRMAARVAQRDLNRSTLGDLLYRNNAKDQVLEAEWIELVRAVGARDQYAFQTLYLWTHRLVFTLILRITNDRSTTKEAVLDVFYELWQGASEFEPLDNTVVGWIMNKARFRALRAGPLRIDATAAAQSLEPISDPLSDSPRFSAALWEQIAERITGDENDTLLPTLIAIEHEADWQQPAFHISCKILARDTQRDRVSMLVRLDRGGEYPPHMHAGVEQLHLLQGELWIDARKLFPGDYSSSEPASVDERIWSETGCTCILITSSRDILS
jgi:ChrR Cupin-like domain